MSGNSCLVPCHLAYWLTSASLFWGFLGTITPVYAQSITPAPDGTGTVVTPDGTQLIIDGGTLSGDRANLFHSFQQFNLETGQTAHFLATPQLRNILGRVVGGDPSRINGILQVTGGSPNLYLVNPAGILFGANAQLNLPAAFTASTATGLGFNCVNGRCDWWSVDRPADFSRLNGLPDGFAFVTSQPGAIVNAGNLAVQPGQSLLLLGGTVINTGTLSAPDGSVTIAAVPGNHWVRLSQSGSLLNLEFAALPTTQTDLTPLTLPQLLTGGDLDSATGLSVNPDGSVALTGSQRVLPTTAGTAIASGTITTSGQTGGSITVVGDQVGIVGATLDASGTTGGGTVRIGGELQGQGRLPNASRTVITADSLVRANASESGNGGQVIVWADDSTRMAGRIEARGGAIAGHGGFVEVSGKETLSLTGQVDVSAPAGQAGQVLLDPRDITIVAGTGSNDSDLLADNQILFADGGDTDFVIGTSILGTAITGDVILQATRNINLTTDLTYTGGSLTLTAGNAFNGAGFNVATTGGAVTINAGTIAVGSISTDAGSLGNPDVRGGAITLTSTTGAINVDSLTSTATSVDGSAAIGGAVTLNAATNLSVGSITTDGSTLEGGTAQAGAISLTSRGGSITANNLVATSFSAFDGNAQGGAVTVNAATNVVVNSITTDAIAADPFTPQGGAIALTTTGAGTIRVIGTTSLPDTTVASLSSTGYIFEPATETNTIATGGAISITHGGGITNSPFVVGDASFNGTTGTIASGSSRLTTGSFPTEPTSRLSSIPTPSGIAIASVNTPPVLTATTNFTVPLGSTSLTLRYSDLAPVVSDIDGDLNSIQIGTIAPGVTVLINGLAATPGSFISALDILTVTLPSGSAALAAFTLQANDSAALSAPVAIVLTPAPVVSVVPGVPSSPTPSTPSISGEPIPFCSINNCRLPSLLPLVATGELNRLSAIAVDLPDDRFSRQYAAYLGLPPQPDVSVADAQGIALQVEEATGVRIGFVYLGFVPVSQSAIAATNLLQVMGGDPQRNQDQLEVIIVTGAGKTERIRVAGVTRQQVIDVAKEFRLQVADPRRVRSQTYLTIAQQLYRWLVQPMHAELQRRQVTNLVFIADEGLRSLPFAALHDGTQFLIEQYSLGSMPSLGLTDTRLQDISQAQVLGLGISESTEGLPPLPAVTTELTRLQQIWRGKAFLNEAATLAQLQAARQQQPFGIIHLATHASFQPGQLENSYIQLWDQKLRFRQIRELGWNNPPVQLLVLSACETAVGDREAELGFAGMAVQTGAQTALASLWNVNDIATNALIGQFYQNLRSARIKAEALQQTQIAMLRGQIAPNLLTPDSATSPTAVQPELFSHPYYWAAFTLIGSPW